MPTPEPTVNVPTMPPVVIKPAFALCMEPGDCSCPSGTIGTCTLTCGGTAGCKDGLIECNNDGYPCVINCDAEQACTGSSSVDGGHSEVTLNCQGETACESLQVNAENDLNVVCTGMQSCKNAMLNYGEGVGRLSCTGAPDSCIGVAINLPYGFTNLPKVSFACFGPFCPQSAPSAFSNVYNGAQAVKCVNTGDCGCIPGTTEVCVINCEDGGDACKDGIISCNNDGYECVVNCLSENACSGSARIMGPANAALTVNCEGGASCDGDTHFGAIGGTITDMSVFCNGLESCGGDLTFNYGTGRGRLQCNSPDACMGRGSFNSIAVETPGASFECHGPNCKAFAPEPFVNPLLPPPTPQPVPPPVAIIQPPPRPLPTLSRFVPSPVPLVPRNVQTVRPVRNVQPVPVQPMNPVFDAQYCCQTSIPNFRAWQGRCWGLTDEQACDGEIAGRCEWNPNECFGAAPTCLMRNDVCVRDNDCCSGVCVPADTFGAGSGTVNKCR